ncbi:MAG: alpha/beta hydrolase [bacterium]
MATLLNLHVAAHAQSDNNRIGCYLDSGYFNLVVESKTQTLYQLEQSADLKTWFPFYPFLGTGSTWTGALDPTMIQGSPSFYRFRAEDIPFEIESGFITMSDGARMYRMVGGSGPLLVFIHGGTQTSRDWLAQMVNFGTSNRVAIYDLRGFGRSSLTGWEDSPWNWSWSQTNRATLDLSELIDSITNGPVQICGLSMGSAIAAQFAVMYSNRVSKLILASPWFGYTFPRDSQLQSLNALSNRTLVLVGSEDTWGSQQEVQWAQGQGYGATVTTVEGADHTMNTSRNEAFNALVHAFLEGN